MCAAASYFVHTRQRKKTIVAKYCWKLPVIGFGGVEAKCITHINKQQQQIQANKTYDEFNFKV